MVKLAIHCEWCKDSVIDIFEDMCFCKPTELQNVKPPWQDADQEEVPSEIAVDVKLRSEINQRKKKDGSEQTNTVNSEVDLAPQRSETEEDSKTETKEEKQVTLSRALDTRTLTQQMEDMLTQRSPEERLKLMQNLMLKYLPDVNESKRATSEDHPKEPEDKKVENEYVPCSEGKKQEKTTLETVEDHPNEPIDKKVKNEYVPSSDEKKKAKTPSRMVHIANTLGDEELNFEQQEETDGGRPKVFISKQHEQEWRRRERLKKELEKNAQSLKVKENEKNLPEGKWAADGKTWLGGKESLSSKGGSKIYVSDTPSEGDKNKNKNEAENIFTPFLDLENYEKIMENILDLISEKDGEILTQQNLVNLLCTLPQYINIQNRYDYISEVIRFLFDVESVFKINADGICTAGDTIQKKHEQREILRNVVKKNKSSTKEELLKDSLEVIYLKKNVKNFLHKICLQSISECLEELLNLKMVRRVEVDGLIFYSVNEKGKRKEGNVKDRKPLNTKEKIAALKKSGIKAKNKIGFGTNSRSGGWSLNKKLLNLIGKKPIIKKNIIENIHSQEPQNNPLEISTTSPFNCSFNISRKFIYLTVVNFKYSEIMKKGKDIAKRICYALGQEQKKNPTKYRCALCFHIGHDQKFVEDAHRIMKCEKYNELPKPHCHCLIYSEDQTVFTERLLHKPIVQSFGHCEVEVLQKVVSKPVLERIMGKKHTCFYYNMEVFKFREEHRKSHQSLTIPQILYSYIEKNTDKILIENNQKLFKNLNKENEGRFTTKANINNAHFFFDEAREELQYELKRDTVWPPQELVQWQTKDEMQKYLKLILMNEIRPKSGMTFKQGRIIVLVGPTDVGKSTLILGPMEKYLNFYWLSKDPKFNRSLFGVPDVVAVDEVPRNFKSLEFMNDVADLTKGSYRQVGGTTERFETNCLMFLSMNNPLEEVWPEIKVVREWFERNKEVAPEDREPAPSCRARVNAFLNRCRVFNLTEPIFPFGKPEARKMYEKEVVSRKRKYKAAFDVDGYDFEEFEKKFRQQY